MSPGSCKLHPNYNGSRKPKSGTKNPEGGVFEGGCPTCWEIYAAARQAEAEAARPVKHRSTKAVAAQVQKADTTLKTGKLTVGEPDPDTGEYPVMYGSRCLFTGPTIDSVYDFMAGFAEGLRFNGKDHVGDNA